MGVARTLEEPLSVGADPDDLLSAVAQQREDAAVDVDVFGDELLALFGGGAQADDAVGLERDDVVPAVTDDARYAAHPGDLVVHLLEIDRLAPVGKEFVECSGLIDVVDAAAVGKGVFGKAGCRDPFGKSESERTVARGEVGRDAEDAPAGEQPEVVLRVELQGEQLLVADACGHADPHEAVLYGIVGVAQLFGREDDDLVAAARHDAVQPLEIGMPLNPLGIGIEQVESVVGAEPEE